MSEKAIQVSEKADSVPDLPSRPADDESVDVSISSIGISAGAAPDAVPTVRPGAGAHASAKTPPLVVCEVLETGRLPIEPVPTHPSEEDPVAELIAPPSGGRDLSAARAFALAVLSAAGFTVGYLVTR